MYMGLILAQSVRVADCIDFSNIACGGWGSSLRSCWLLGVISFGGGSPKQSVMSGRIV